MSEFQSVVATYHKRFQVEPRELVNSRPQQNLEFIIVVPSFREKEISFLNHLNQVTFPTKKFEIIIVANDAEQHEESIKSITRIKEQIATLNVLNLDIHLVEKLDFDSKKHGVGLARKWGMDEALKRFGKINRNGWIVCLDADCQIAEDYFRVLENQLDETYASATLNFEHPYTELNTSHKSGIINYELFLRYYKECLTWMGFPFYYHTIGSSMAVRAAIYAKSGGMNQRKAGEDFYFMHKVFPMGRVVEINTPIVYPSARTSTRVPFGTGRAMLNWQDTNQQSFPTYSFEIFTVLKEFLSGASAMQQEDPAIPHELESFLLDFNFEKKLQVIRQKSPNQESFFKNFYQLFNGFTILKIVHFLRDEHFGEKPIEQVASELLKEKHIRPGHSLEELLDQFRKLQRGNPNS